MLSLLIFLLSFSTGTRPHAETVEPNPATVALDALEIASLMRYTLPTRDELCDEERPAALGGQQSELFIATDTENPPYDRSVTITFDKVEDIPLEIRQQVPGEMFERNKDGKWHFTIALPNDSAGLGIWTLVSGDEQGDDFGSTHGVLVEAGRSVNGLHFTGSFQTNLYTRQATPYFDGPDGRRTVGQFFTEENIFKIIVDNKDKGGVTYWQLGAGIIELNSEETRNWLFATGEQRGFHRVAGGPNNINIPDGLGIRRGAYAEASVGRVFADAVSRGGQWRIRATGEVGIAESTLPDTGSLSIRSNVAGFYQRPGARRAYMAELGFETRFHETSNSPSTDVVAGFGVAGHRGNSARLSIRETQAGSRQNYVNYNLDTDRTYTVEFNRNFGRSQSATVGSFDLSRKERRQQRREERRQRRDRR